MHKCIYYFESKSIICIEPSKIPYAGNIDICCFDLIGTLTTNEFNILGVINANDNDDLIASCVECDENVISILLGCNNLNNAEGKIFGEPIDISIMKEMKGKITNNEISCNNRKIKIIPIKKYIFESELRRITVLAKVYNDYEKDDYSIRVMCKGAPEVIKNILKEVPENYDECYLKWAKKGYHIIALAYNDNEKYNINTERNILEKGLIFAGFCIFEIPIKDKVEKYMNELIKSKYDICIITGESLLTSLKIMKELKIGDSNKYACLTIEEKKLFLKNIDSNKLIQELKSIEEIKIISKEYNLCITSEEYKNLTNITSTIPNIYLIIPYIKLFCRMSKKNKIQIISNLKLSGRNPLMCGDGTNDIGALKTSNVGVTLLNLKESFVDKRDFLYFEEDTIIKN
jgi:cation-transporting ATPase 13A1